MKLYLSSNGIPNGPEFCDFVGKPCGEIKIAIIFNAMDYKSEDARTERLTNTLASFKSHGITQVDEVDLRNNQDKTELKNILSTYDVVWVNGGNVYLLRWYLKKYGLANLLLELGESGVIYAGDSAGAVVVGPTLKHYDAADDPNVAPEQLWEGLSWIDTAIIPHWGGEKYAEVLNTIKEQLENDVYRTRCLTDEESWCIEI